MNVQAIAKNVRISPRKVRLVADAIRSMDVTQAMFLLQAQQQQAARPLAKALKSAVANAVTNNSLDAANLIVGAIMVNQGPAYKRFRPSTRGRIHPYKKRGSNITIVVSEKVVAKAAVKVEEKKAVKEEKKEAKK
jgi:ribosomal protein L22, bacterial type